jgi:hypothetical protein
VRRRYQDFLWLWDKLKREYQERIIPPLPEKNRLEYLGRFTPDFIKRRQIALRRFLFRIDAHPTLTGSETFHNFLQVPIVGMNSKDSLILPTTGSFDNLSISKDDKLSMDINSNTNNITTTTTTNNKSNSSPPASSSYLKPVIDGLGDFISGGASIMFSRAPNSIPEAFQVLRKNVQIAQNHLGHLETLFSSRVMNYQPAIIEGMKEIAGSFDELAASIDLSLNNNAPISNREEHDVNTEPPSATPPFVKSMLSRVSATMTQCAHLLDKSLDEQELHILSVLAEYGQYCDVALETIQARDRRQVEVEELTKLIEGYQGELEALNGSLTITNESNTLPLSADTEESLPSTLPIDASKEEIPSRKASSASIYEYLSSKWDSWKGVDPITARKNRLARLQLRLEEAENALKTSQEYFSKVNESLQSEISAFFVLLQRELGFELTNHCGMQVKYHETSLIYWKDFLAWLDNPPKHL